MRAKLNEHIIMYALVGWPSVKSRRRRETIERTSGENRKGGKEEGKKKKILKKEKEEREIRGKDGSLGG